MNTSPYTSDTGTYLTESEASTYRAPVAGVYQVAAEIIRMEPTGETEMVPNPDKRWYTFWLPTLVERPVFRRIVDYSGSEIVIAKEGDILRSPCMRLGT